jgi:hypothetical protein
MRTLMTVELARAQSAEIQRAARHVGGGRRHRDGIVRMLLGREPRPAAAAEYFKNELTSNQHALRRASRRAG